MDTADTSPLPAEFVNRLQTIVPADHFATAQASFAVAKPVSARINTLKGDVEGALGEVRGLGLEPARVAWLDEAFCIPGAKKRQLTDSAAVTEGRVYVQGLSSMLAAPALAPHGCAEVLDLAAAPGGKTLHLAALMQGSGRLAAVEPVRARYFTLKDNLARCGAEFVHAYNSDGRDVGRKTPGRFDRVLLDAPCSSEARFDCRDPASWQYWGPRKIAECARKQKALLRSAVDATRVGGRVLYCTCSLAPEENELVVAHTLRRLQGTVELLPLKLPVPNVQPGLAEWQGKTLPGELALCRRILPTEQMDALFLALLEKRGSMQCNGPD
ncbi:MAG: rRNA cytosine-C5-methyltransferase [Planctomycetaceae bacterium]|nr:rRNA cytosine-C5-methyltransferase [Planctomycetaceae bacterium]